MKTLKTIIFLVMMATVTMAHADRLVTNINRYWLYQQGDVAQGADATTDNGQWTRVSLPHSFSMPYFMSRDFYTGYGWYRKTVDLKASQLDDGRRHTLEFDGVFQVAEVYVNGRLMGSHTGGYTGFEVDITDALHAGENLVAIRVNNLWQADVAPRAGEHTFSGGIYRNVRWVEKSAQHIAWCGLAITTPSLAKNQGQTSEVCVDVQLNNKSASQRPLTLTIEVIDANCKVVGKSRRKVTLQGNDAQSVSLSTPAIKSPKLWSPEQPSLYRLRATLADGRKVIDTSEDTFGFRWMEWTADHGFFLNGQHRYFQGANVHQDQAGWGDAVTDGAMRRDVQMMRQAGFDFIRGSHYPHAPGFVQACDEEGIMFWSEAPFWGIGGFKADGYWNSSAYPVDSAHEQAFEASALQQLEEMIRIHRNHPSIIAWSMSNEPFFSAKNVIPGVHRLLKRMVERTHQLDPTRPAAIGGSQRPMDTTRIDLLGDLAGYNGDGATLPVFQRPGVPSVVSEYGSYTADRPGKYEPGWNSLNQDDAWRGVEWRSGHAIWCGFDHGSIAGSTLGKMGIVDYFRIPKRAYYWYRNYLAHQAPPTWPIEGKPARLRLTASKTQDVKTDGTDDVWLLVEVLDANGHVVTATPDVVLTIVSGPGELPTGRAITFSAQSDIRIQDGQAAIAMRAYEAGLARVEARAEGLESAQVEVEFAGTVAFQEGRTALVADRPYVRYERKKVEEQTFGVNNPTFVSSQTATHPAGHAADGNNATWWAPQESDKQPMLTLDTEKGLNITSVELRFPQSQAWQYVVEGSIDGQQWLPIADCSGNNENIDRWVHRPQTASQSVMRFVRIRFTRASQAAVGEIIVKGFVADRR